MRDVTVPGRGDLAAVLATGLAVSNLSPSPRSPTGDDDHQAAHFASWLTEGMFRVIPLLLCAVPPPCWAGC